MRPAPAIVTLGLALLGWTAPGAPVQAESTRNKARTEYRRATTLKTVYWVPRAERPRRALLEEGGIVTVYPERAQKGSGCRAKWVPVKGGGYLCLDGTEVTREAPKDVPAMVDDLLPFVYVHETKNPAMMYGYSPVADKPGRLERYGRALDETKYTRHKPSRFRGRNLRTDPVPRPQLVPGWAVVADAPVYATAGGDDDPGTPSMTLDLHTPLLVSRFETEAGWFKVWDPAGNAPLGFMQEGPLRRFDPAPAPEGLAKGQSWVDIDVNQQMLALYAGPEPVYVTLVSTGLEERETPLGVFEMNHKLAYRTMVNLPDSADKYRVENVPWAMYFAPYYAVHGAYWHNEFGNRRSHGCVNLAPKDARYIYGQVGPHHQPGFFKTFASEHAPPSVVRVRDGQIRNLSALVKKGEGDS